MTYKVSTYVEINDENEEAELEKVKSLLADYASVLAAHGYAQVDPEDEEESIKSFISINTVEADFDPWLTEELQSAFLVILPTTLNGEEKDERDSG